LFFASGKELKLPMINHYGIEASYIQEAISSEKKVIHKKIKERCIALKGKPLTEKPFIFCKADSAECKTSCIIGFQHAWSLPLTLVTVSIIFIESNVSPTKGLLK